MAFEEVSLSPLRCLICDCSTLKLVPGFEQLPRISSDCRPFAAGGKISVCLRCSLVQKIPDERWLAEISSIYKDYTAYSVGGGAEQLVMDPLTGQPRKRSEVLVNELDKLNILPQQLRALDVGCGHGVTLQAMADTFPYWHLFGHELDDTNRQQLESISGFEKLFTGGLNDIEGEFGWVSMIHSLEHFVAPLNALESLFNSIELQGHLFVEVCNLDENPFDLLVADHLTHFTPQTLAYAVAYAGFEVVSMETKWVKKELSMLATRTYRRPEVTSNCEGGSIALEAVTSKVRWLNSLISSAQKVASEPPAFGIFGTSIAGTWLGSILSDKVKFFVDEDPSRIGREFLGKPILGPDAIPIGANVYVALAPSLAEALVQRLSTANPNVRYLLPN